MTTLAPPAPPAPARHAAAPAPSFLRHTGALAWRGIVKTIHSTEALLDVSAVPVPLRERGDSEAMALMRNSA